MNGNRILCKLINTENNIELIKNCPHRSFMDMTIVYCFFYRDLIKNIPLPFEKARNVVITNEFFEKHKNINDNEEFLYNSSIANMDYLHIVIGPTEENHSFTKEESKFIYSLHNEAEWNGATAILSEEHLELLSDIYIKNNLGEDYILLPISIYSFLIIPFLFIKNEQRLLILQKAIINNNLKHLKKYEVLSKNIYYYSPETGLKIFDENMRRSKFYENNKIAN